MSEQVPATVKKGAVAPSPSNGGLGERPKTMREQIKAAQAEVATWPPSALKATAMYNWTLIP